MDFLQIIALAVLQGLTEFLPISSSAHLILLPIIAGWEDQGLAFDVAVHIGTLLAVIFYFRQQLRTLINDWFRSIQRGQTVGDSKLAWAIGLGTIPVGLAGLLFNDAIEFSLRDPLVIAATTIGFGLLLGWADWQGKRVRDEHSLRWQDILFIGVAQAISLIPGTSRSGITMTAGLMLGLTRQAAARFSFLLSIPVTFLAGTLKTTELIVADTPTDWMVLLYGAAFSAISAYLCIVIFLKLLERIGMWPFVVYRLILGAILLWLFL
ncbi:MAG: undecaprenyl-diphosphate phosphatase [Methylophaga sp.]|nr:undecaprenyl-diphosphate phosphatase [Methylophaga sp.]